MKKLLWFISCFLILFTGLNLLGQQSGSEYSIINKIHLTGDGGWDYLTVDENGGRLFVSHGTVVQVIDLKTNLLTGTINETPGVHGIAIAQDLNKAFISVGRNGSVKVINLKTLASIADVKITGENPDAIMYEGFSKKVFVFNGRTANASVIDAATNEVFGTIALAGKPEFPVSDDNGNLYVNIEDKSLISVIDVKTLKVLKSWPIAPGEEASGLALDNETHRLFAVCSNKLMVVVDAIDGHVVTTLPIGAGCDGVKFDPGMKRAYSSNGEGTMTVVQEINKDSFKVLENVATVPGARTLAVDNKTHHIYLPTAEFNPAPEATADNPRPRRTPKPDSFFVIDIVPVKK
ncbi:MAG: YncE family protein [Bacteroidetes bacterium]|nr:MAG: YncE family protein [Bacteroidota bacterium]